MCKQLSINGWFLKFNMQSLFNSDLIIIFNRINIYKIITWNVWLACFAWWQMIEYSRKWSTMLLYPCARVSDCFTNVSINCITQTCEFIDTLPAILEKDSRELKSIKMNQKNEDINICIYALIQLFGHSPEICSVWQWVCWFSVLN